MDLKRGSLLLTEEPPVAMWAQRRRLIDRTDLIFFLAAQKRIAETYMTLRLSQRARANLLAALETQFVGDQG